MLKTEILEERAHAVPREHNKWTYHWNDHPSHVRHNDTREGKSLPSPKSPFTETRFPTSITQVASPCLRMASNDSSAKVRKIASKMIMCLEYASWVETRCLLLLQLYKAGQLEILHRTHPIKVRSYLWYLRAREQ
mmetsp:Transcript_31353/g.72167  ORF Transcript_31353/g.72167 Transcript_31353/m.72167 type:complete len:135 (-) Transcript_31353:1927-2331(-)